MSRCIVIISYWEFLAGRLHVEGSITLSDAQIQPLLSTRQTWDFRRWSWAPRLRSKVEGAGIGELRFGVCVCVWARIERV